MPDFLDQNKKLGAKPSLRDVVLWHIFTRGPERYLGNVVCDGSEVFRWMDKLDNNNDSLTAVPDEMFDTHPHWVGTYRAMMENAVVIPFDLVKAATAEQSFRRRLKATT